MDFEFDPWWYTSFSGVSRSHIFAFQYYLLNFPIFTTLFMISILTAMIQILRKGRPLSYSFFSIALTGFAQKSADSVKILTGKKPFNKFSVGINAGVLKSSVIAGGSNDFTNNKLNLGYGLNVKYQLTHAIAFQADFIAGNLSGDQSKVQGTDTLNLSKKPVVAFKTHINIAGSVSAVYTFSNINWLNLKTGSCLISALVLVWPAGM